MAEEITLPIGKKGFKIPKWGLLVGIGGLAAAALFYLNKGAGTSEAATDTSTGGGAQPITPTENPPIPPINQDNHGLPPIKPVVPVVPVNPVLPVLPVQPLPTDLTQETPYELLNPAAATPFSVLSIPGVAPTIAGAGPGIILSNPTAPIEGWIGVSARGGKNERLAYNPATDPLGRLFDSFVNLFRPVPAPSGWIGAAQAGARGPTNPTPFVPTPAGGFTAPSPASVAQHRGETPTSPSPAAPGPSWQEVIQATPGYREAHV